MVFIFASFRAMLFMQLNLSRCVPLLRFL